MRQYTECVEIVSSSILSFHLCGCKIVMIQWPCHPVSVMQIPSNFHVTSLGRMLSVWWCICFSLPGGSGLWAKLLKILTIWGCLQWDADGWECHQQSHEHWLGETDCKFQCTQLFNHTFASLMHSSVNVLPFIKESAGSCRWSYVFLS
jgi:hypothetical protein